MVRIREQSPHCTYIVGLVILSVVLYRDVLARRLPRPPGPKGLPLVGNIFGMPQQHPWKAYKDWSDQYGSDIVSVTAFGKCTVIVNSYNAAQELFSQRSTIYSHRPEQPMVNDLVGWGSWAVGQLQYGQAWKDQRKIFKSEIETPEAKLHEFHALRAARRCLGQILDSPHEYLTHIRHMAGYASLSTAYGLDVKSHEDPLIDVIERTMYSMAVAGNFGVYLVDYIPALRYLPTWFPGAKFKRDALEWSKDVLALPRIGYDIAKQSYIQGTMKECIASHVLERIQGDEDSEDKEVTLRNVLGGFYAAGTHTTVSVILTFILAMNLYPDVQRKAQEEIEVAVGKDRLPEFDDLTPENVPYLHAVVKEALRWQPALPLAAPHATCEDDVYRGYAIPKGTTVVGNSWAMLRDESLFGPETDVFKPERFLTQDRDALDPSVPDPEMAFGFGRRLCAGRFVAFASVLISGASLLHCFDIRKAKDENGKEIVPEVEYTTGLLSFPKPFECDFKVRSEKMRLLVQELSMTPEH
ncbi:cytochrome P450 [Pluteus cervinus]|uniref:Cytochrome P450 n=1 Tax=Pluteus cervinus TaxID=181527 RepID=A0ACD3AW56_9AGAR|nr:cytochrome P450 [Pluteus cervinus]